ncbi:MAG: 30S ribosomal protein S1, partial [Fidelibacterota bacterium]
MQINDNSHGKFPEEEEKGQEKSGSMETSTHKEQAANSGKEEEVLEKKEEYEVETYDLKEIEEKPEYTPKEYEEMKKLYNETLKDISEGELIKGRVLSIGEKEVTVDIGFKSEGIIPVEDFDDIESVKIGDEIEILLDRIEDDEGQLVLSKKKADFMRVWERIREAGEKGEIVEGKILRRIKGGMVVDLMGIDAFLPGSQIDVKPIQDFDAYVGQKMEFKIVKINEARKNVVLSRREIIEEGLKEKRKEILKSIKVGQVLEGKVKNITDFGVFVDLGGVDGLLHITDISWGRINHPSEVVS